MASSSFTDTTFYFYIWSSLMIAVSFPLIWWLYQNYCVKNTKNNKKRDNTNTSHGEQEEHYSTVISRRHSGIEKVGSSETNKRYQRSISDSHESMQQESSAFLSHHHSSPKSESSSIYNIQKDYEELCTNLTKDFKTISQPQHISSNQSIQDQEASSTTIPRTNIFNSSNNIDSKKKRQHIRSNSNPSFTFASYFQRDNMSNNENLNNGNNNKSQNYNNCNSESEEESSSDSQDNDDNDGEDDDLHSRFAKRWPNIKTVSPYNKICLPPTCQKVEIVSSSSLGRHSYLQQYNIKTYRQIRYYAASHNYLNGVDGWIPSFFLQIKQFLENTIKIFLLFLPTGWRILTRSLFSFGKSNTEDKEEEEGGEENDVNGKINSDEGSERTIHHQNSFLSHEEEKKTDDNTSSLILREGNTKLCTTPTNAPAPSSSSSYLPRNESVSSFMSLINDDEYEQKDQDQYYSLLATEQQQQSHPHISTIFSTYNNKEEKNDIITAPKRTTNKEETTNSAISHLSSMKFFDAEATIIRQAQNNNNNSSNNNNLVMNAPDKYGYIFNFDNDFGLDAMPNNSNTNNTSSSAGTSTSLHSYRSIDGIHNFNSSFSNNSIHPFSHTPSSYALVSNHYNHHHQQQHSSQPVPSFSATTNTAATSSLLATSTAPQQQKQQQQLQSTNQFTPLLVFVNSRSGPQQGALLINQLRSLLNPIQIWDLSDGSPEPILQSFSVLKNLRILVCGGDGTVAWIVSSLENLKLKQRRWPPIAILPLGTGNDLARIHGWGGGYSNERSLLGILNQISEAYVSLLDRWEIEVTQDEQNSESNNIDTKKSSSTLMKKKKLKNHQQTDYGDDRKKESSRSTSTKKKSKTKKKKKNTNKSFMNYLGIGVDAQTALQVHQLRESKPKLFFSRFINKAWYGLFGADEQLKANCAGFSKKVKLVADGVHIPLPADSQGIIFLNIDSYMGGTALWSHGVKPPPNNNKKKQQHQRRYSDGDASFTSVNAAAAAYKKAALFSHSGDNSTPNSSYGLTFPSRAYYDNKRKHQTDEQSVPSATNANIRENDEPEQQTDDEKDDDSLTPEQRYEIATACNLPSSCQDGLLDVVSVRSVFHLGQIRVGLSNAQLICQCHTAQIHVREEEIAMQVDGEPWKQPKYSQIQIKKKEQPAMMLHRADDGGYGVETEMASLIDWAEEKNLIDGKVHDALMKEFSRRIESKVRMKRLVSQEKLFSLKRVMSSNKF